MNRDDVSVAAKAERRTLRRHRLGKGRLHFCQSR